MDVGAYIHFVDFQVNFGDPECYEHDVPPLPCAVEASIDLPTSGDTCVGRRSAPSLATLATLAAPCCSDLCRQQARTARATDRPAVGQEELRRVPLALVRS